MIHPCGRIQPRHPALMLSTHCLGRRYHLSDREDYRKYNKICGAIRALAARLKKLPNDSRFRATTTDTLLTKLYNMGCPLTHYSLFAQYSPTHHPLTIHSLPTSLPTIHSLLTHHSLTIHSLFTIHSLTTHSLQVDHHQKEPPTVRTDNGSHFL